MSCASPAELGAEALASFHLRCAPSGPPRRSGRRARSGQGFGGGGGLRAGQEVEEVTAEAAEAVAPPRHGEALLGSVEGVDAAIPETYASLRAAWLPVVRAAIEPVLARRGWTPEVPVAAFQDDEELVKELLGAAWVALFPPEPGLESGRFDLGVDLFSHAGEVESEPEPEVDFPMQAGQRPLCLEDPAFVGADQRLMSLANIMRLPVIFNGESGYIPELMRSFFEARYKCAGVDETDFAAYFNKYDVIAIGKMVDFAFTDQALDVVLNGRGDPDALWAGVLLHEHVHRIENEVFFNNTERFALMGYNCASTERNAAYLQGLYYGESTCAAQAFGLFYALHDNQVRKNDVERAFRSLDTALGGALKVLPSAAYLLELSTCFHGLPSVFRAEEGSFDPSASAESIVTNAVLLTEEPALTAAALTALPSSSGGLTPEMAGALVLVLA